MSTKDAIRTGVTSVEVYRSNDAAPENWADAKFWLINELRRIQSGFFSVDEVISSIGTDGESNTIVNNITNTIINQIENEPPASIVGPQGEKGEKGDTGPQGPVGPQGPAGLDGKPSDTIKDYRIAIDSTWSSDKITKYISEITNGLTGGGAAVTIGDTVPTSANTGDLFFDNVNTFDLYVYDGTNWINTDKDHREVYVQRNIPQTNPLKPYLWVQTGMGSDEYGFTLWFNDPEY